MPSHFALHVRSFRITATSLRVTGMPVRTTLMSLPIIFPSLRIHPYITWYLSVGQTRDKERRRHDRKVAANWAQKEIFYSIFNFLAKRILHLINIGSAQERYMNFNGRERRLVLTTVAEEAHMILSSSHIFFFLRHIWNYSVNIDVAISIFACWQDVRAKSCREYLFRTAPDTLTARVTKKRRD